MFYKSELTLLLSLLHRIPNPTASYKPNLTNSKRHTELQCCCDRSQKLCQPDQFAVEYMSRPRGIFRLEWSVMHCHSQDANYKCFYRIRRCVSVFDTNFVSDICFGYWRRNGTSDKSDDSLGSNQVAASESKDFAVFAAGSIFQHSISIYWSQWASF